MSPVTEIVVDTVVLQKANAPIQPPLREGSKIARRVCVLKRIRSGDWIVLISERLLEEYREHVREPRNDFVRAFFEIVSDPQRRVLNWKTPWSGSLRVKARKCRFPSEDKHVLRTAIRPDPSAIVTEEDRMLRSHKCILREFRVSIIPP